MSAVIEFPADRVSARQAPARFKTAEVLLFTGVQVVRREIAPPERSKPARSVAAQSAADPS